MSILKQLYTAVILTAALTLVLGIIYPLLVTGLAQIIFSDKAQGSLIRRDGRVIGSRLIGQPFSGPGYFHSRPSAAGAGYDATASGGTNLGPTSRKLILEQVKERADRLRADNIGAEIPIDLVTSSSSGLDPHITPSAARFQLSRVAGERRLSEEEVWRIVLEHTEGRQLGFLGEPRVNVFELNLALDARQSLSASKGVRAGK
ncbi:MAG TPA: potassium-transporting ATPase subunit KdpC [Blastocatellia bacterium]|nr:potassium-transporting ATPase subunit KdpC [Blastocatellia bacterium]